MKNVLIVTDLSFPTGSAMASRILSFCHIFNDLGHNVHVITGKLESENVKYDEVINSVFYSYEVVSSKRNYRTQSYFGNENLPKRVDEYLTNNEVEFVFTTSLNANFKKVFDVCKKHNKKIILEQCEWFDASSYTFNTLDPRYKTFIKNINNNFIKVDGVIAISRLLFDYYNDKNVKAIRIPSILNIQAKPFSSLSKNEKIKLVYTGNASKSKELLKPILEALSSKLEYLDNFIFDIYGLDRKDVISNIGNKELLNGIEEIVNIHGFVEQEEIEDILLNSDYQIFIRPNRRSSNAGFPTKLAESMAVGTSVITNDTGDIGLYVLDGTNGYICENSSSEAVKKVFDRILNNKNISLRGNARKQAMKSFDYRTYLDDVKQLIESL